MLLTVEQAAKQAQVSVKTIRRRIVEGRLHAENWGTAKRADWRIAPEALANLKPISQPGPLVTLPPQRGGRRPRSLVRAARQYHPDA